MTSYAEARWLPRGWAHLALQFAVWFGFYAVYQVVRGAADREVAEAFWNGTLVIEAENRLHALIEPTVQSFVQSSGVLIFATSYTYWLSQFAVVGLTLLYVYFRHYDRFADFRNWLIGANVIGLIGYVLMPTAPPRMFPEWGFSDTLADYASVNHDSGLIAFAANPYAAMPSLHAMDALIVGVVMASVCRSWPARALWLVWPAWVCFAVMGTGNHYWLDCVAGFADRAPHRAPALPQAPSTRARGHRVSEPGDGSGLESGANAVSQLDRVKQEYTAAAREILRRSMQGVARTKLTPDMLSIAGLALCVAGAVLVGFEQRNEYLFFWLGGVLFVAGSIADILDGALARAAGKGTVFGAFLDSTFDRLGEAAMLTAIGLVFMRDGNEVALVATFLAVIGSMLVSYTRAKAEMLGLRGDVGFGSRLERVVIVSVGLGLAPWGWLQWPIYLLALMAWVTVVQRMLFVRRQLRELAEPA